MTLAELQTVQKIERLTLHQKHIQEMEALKQKQEIEMENFISKLSEKN
jgi:3-oxoacyl-[acyl-carrier-protein] synthase III